jgi:hypothetical protein
MEIITRTVLGSYLQTVLLQDLPFEVELHTTLNEKFGILKDELPPIGKIPRMRYFTIGCGGHQMAVGSNGKTKPDPLQHRSRDFALFEHMPFVIREANNDLSAGERARYCLRREEIHNGLRYFAYYGKRIIVTNVRAAMEYVTIRDGQDPIVSKFIPDSSDLNPIPQTLGNTGVQTVAGDYIAASAKSDISFTKADVAELKNVAIVLYGDADLAIISELALCSGLDKTVQAPGASGTTITFNEVICCQVVTHFNTFSSMVYNVDGLDIVLDVGATEPLFLITDPLGGSSGLVPATVGTSLTM